MLIFRNDKGKRKTVQEGFSFVAFFFPHIWVFVKGLYGYGFLFVAFIIIQILTSEGSMTSDSGIDTFYWIISLILRIYIGIRGNDIVKENLIKLGYYQVGKCKTALEYFQRAQGYLKEERYTQAIKDFTSSIKIENTNPDAYLSRGMAYSNSEKYIEALSDYNKSIELNKENPSAYFCRGKVNIELDDVEGACKDFKKAHELGDKDADNMIKEHCSH